MRRHGYLVEKVTDEELAAGRQIIGDGRPPGHIAWSERFRYETRQVRLSGNGNHGPAPAGEGILHIREASRRYWVEGTFRRQDRENGVLMLILTFVTDHPGQAVEGGFAGEHFEIRLWDSQTLSRLSAPEHLREWTAQFVDVFSGEILCRILDPTDMSLQSWPYIGPRSLGSHIFLPSGVTHTWDPPYLPTRGVVLYLDQ